MENKMHSHEETSRLINHNIKIVLEKIESKKQKSKVLISDLQEEQFLFIQWVNILQLSKSIVPKDDKDLLERMNKEFGEGVLRRIVNKYAPDIIKEFEESILKRIEAIEKTL